MAKIEIKIESEMGDTQFYSPPVIDDAPMFEKPHETEKKVIRELLVGMVRRIYAAYDIPVTVLSDAGSDEDQATKLGEAIIEIVNRLDVYPPTPQFIGRKVLQYLDDPSSIPVGTIRPRPIKDSPQA